MRYTVESWEERDRLGIWVTDNETGKTVFEVWDDDARQMFEDGFFKTGKEFESSVLNYLTDRGILPDRTKRTITNKRKEAP